MSQNKKCTKCDTNKEESEFSKDKTTKSGLSVWCKSCRSVITKRWYKNNKEKSLEFFKNWQIRNPEKRKEHSRNWYRNNKEKAQEYYKLIRQTDLKAYNEKGNIRAKRRYENIKKATIGDSNEIKFFYALVRVSKEVFCSYCKKQLIDKKDRQVDHVLALCNGGKHELKNLVPCCKRCNYSKGKRLVDEFLNELNNNKGIQSHFDSIKT